MHRTIERQKEGASRKNVTYKLRAAHRTLAELESGGPPATSYLDYPWHHLTPELAADYRRHMFRKYDNQGTRNDYMSVVRRVIDQCHRVGLISALRRDEVLDELYTIAPGASTKRRRIKPAELSALLTACEKLPSAAAAARDSAIIAVLRTSGMRVGELCKLDLDDWDRDDETLGLRQTKNGRNHVVFLHPVAIGYLERWVQLRGETPGALLTPLNGRSFRSLNPGYVQQRLRLIADKAGVAPFGSHDFRRTFATELLRSHDAALVGRLLNHTKLASTLIYDLAPEQLQRDAVGSLELGKPPTQDSYEQDGSDTPNDGNASVA